jgi:molybdopterin molybdotransferase
MLSPTEAAAAIIREVGVLPSETVPLLEALDQVLAQDVVSPIDLPGWDNSAMDGYAVRSVDVTGSEAIGGRAGDPAGTGGKTRQEAAAGPGGVTLRIIETIPAGTFPTKPLGPGECARIFTGAPLPQGCDGVIRQEDTTALPDGTVRIDNPRDAGRNVRYLGEDLRRGAVALTRGTPLGPAHLGVLASIASRQVEVHRRPRVAIMASGDEIADLDQADEILSGRKIASSNTYTLLSLIRQAGAVPVNLGIARDDPADVRRRLTTEGSPPDLLVTTAGVSVGEHDYVRSVLEEMGLELRFWRIRMRPGAPVGFGLLREVPWIGLPGNPVSTMVTFELFVRPAIRKMMGYAALFRSTVPVELAEPIRLGPRLRHFLRAIVSQENGKLAVRLTGPQGSGILTSMARANALLIVPEDRPEVPAGETLSAILLDDPRHVAEAPF